jgi:molybdopterin adenylyltransferase
MIRIGILTVSDRASTGGREDLSGAKIRELVVQVPEFIVEVSTIVPDEQARIADTLRFWSDDLRLNLVLTTGGTGFAPRDVTPEATRSVLEREAPGLAEGMRAASLQYTPMAMLSRGVAGVRGRTLIINLPGSPKAVRECLAYILPVLPHAIELLTEGPATH